MFTPQQIDQISFSQAKKAKEGYNMDEVDAFLEPLTEDYVTLYKENALLKSKMRVLVGKLEEYRKNEAAMKDAALNAQRNADKMIREAEAKCAQMLSTANAQAAASAQAAAAAQAQAAAAQASVNADALIAAENARVEEARKAAAAKIQEIQDQMRTCIQALERIKGANAPAAAPVVPAAPVAPVAPAPVAPVAPAPAAPAPVASMGTYDSDAVANEISQNLEALVGTAPEPAPKAAPRHPINDSTTSKFANLNLQFGRNYDPTNR